MRAGYSTLHDGFAHGENLWPMSGRHIEKMVKDIMHKYISFLYSFHLGFSELHSFKMQIYKIFFDFPNKM